MTRIFINEVKKLFNWRILLLIALLGTIVWYVFLGEALDSHVSMTKHGIYGSYQTEMFRTYGGALESNEIAVSFIAKKRAEAYAGGDAIIADNPVFEKYRFNSLSEFLIWYDNLEWYSDWDGTARYYENNAIASDVSSEEVEDRLAMETALSITGAATLEEWYNSPTIRLQSLNMLEFRYVNYRLKLDTFIEHNQRQIVARAAEKILALRNNSLVNDNLMPEFSLYTAVMGAFSILAVIILIMPPLLTDRSRNVNLLQYSSVVGRKILLIQFTASLVSAVILSAVIIIVSVVPFILLAAEYLNVSIMSCGIHYLWLYDISFGQYVFILVGMIIALCSCAACIAFILARFSNNIISAVIKAVPVGLALIGLCAISVNIALSNNNVVFSQVFRGRFNTPEIIVCCVFGVIAIIAALVISVREKRVDVL